MVSESEWHLQVGTGHILSHHATYRDVPLLAEVIRAPETIEWDDFHLSYALEALARCEDFGYIPEIEMVFVEAPHSYDRYRAALAMNATAPTVFQPKYAFECMWDCHGDMRELGCDTVLLSLPGAVGRLKEIATDPHESDDLRRTARLRLRDF
jgi:hypothetical protein